MPDQGSSFIPKTAGSPVRRTRASRRIYLLSYISYVAFFSVLFAVIGTYVYASFINSSLNNIKEQLAAERSRFSTAEIDSIKSLDHRLSTAERLLNELSAPSRVFGDIEKVVASNIAFSGMSYSVKPNRQFEITLTGYADEFNEILRQRDLLSGSSLLNQAEIAEYDYSVAGSGDTTSVSGDATLTFVFSDVRDLSLIPYQTEPVEEEVVVESITSGSEDGEEDILGIPEEDSEPIESDEVDIIDEDAGTSTANDLGS